MDFLNEIVQQCSSMFLGNITDEELQLKLAVEQVSLADALLDNTSDPFSKHGDAIWERTNEVTASEGPVYSLPSDGKPSKDNEYMELVRLDVLVDNSYQLVQKVLSKFTDKEASKRDALEAIKVFTEDLHRAIASAQAVVCVSSDDMVLKTAILQRGQKLEQEMSEISTALRQGRPLDEPASAAPTTFDNASMIPDLNAKDPVALLATFIILALSVFGSLACEWANSALQLQLSLLRAVYAQIQPTGPSPYNKTILDSFPRDVRTARELFEIDPKTISYAACPKCSCLYRDSPDGELPMLCTARRFPQSPPCDEVISKLALKDSSSRSMRRVPIRPFVIQDFDSFKGSLLNRPGMESLLDRGARLFTTASGDIRDIQGGRTIRELTGPDQKPFFNGRPNNELRLAWSLSIDWFNPFLNKIAGRSASVGSIVMSCLNLPPSLRYKPENLFVVGIIPGPREPSVEDIDNFLEPIVDFLDRSWRQGTKFSKTESRPLGRVERSILAVIVADLPGARKITGTASHSSNSSFCSLCRLPKSQIKDFNMDSWPTMSVMAQKTIVETWRDASTQTDRNNIVKKHGIRWSSLWKLDYYNPSKMVIVDAMHNLFLGLVQFHIRQIMDISAPKSDSDGTPSEADMADARDAFFLGRFSRLQRFRLPILELLCKEKDIRVDYSGVRRKKDYLIDKLKQHQSSFLPGSYNVVEAPVGIAADAAQLDGLVGNEYVEECQAQAQVNFMDGVTTGELDKIRECIQSVVRPQYRQGPPKDLGEASHGKLRASQWRTVIEFDLPVSVALIWSRDTSQKPLESAMVDRRDKLFELIMHLAVAIRWGTSYRTSSIHASKYTQNMRSYVQGLCDLYPNISLRPNHHSALHLGQNLLQFGPVHGWWMFPFERVIGKLQKVNTNYKIGELEPTMLRSFCAGANLKALINSEHCPAALLPAVPILKHHLDDIQENTMPLTCTDQVMNVKKLAKGTSRSLGSHATADAFRLAFRAHALDLGEWSDSMQAKNHQHVSIAGTKFSIATSLRRDAEITFCPLQGASRVSGVIESILSMEKHGKEVFIMGIRQRLPWVSTSRTPNPFLRFPEFGAELWSKELATKVLFIPLTEAIYHTQSMPWYDQYVVVKEIKPDF